MLGSLKINNLGTLEVNHDVVLQNNGIIEVEGELIFKSNSFGTAQYGISTGEILGDVTVERFIPARQDQARAFRFISSAVSQVSVQDSWQTATHVTGNSGASNGFDETVTNANSMFTFINGQWNGINSTNDMLKPARGYRLYVRGDRSIDLSSNNSPANDVTLQAKGQLNTGNTTAYDINGVANQFTFVGNPYQAIVDMSEISFGSGVDSGFAYYWDPSLSDNGSFVVIDLTENNTIPSPSSSEANKYLQPGQAVFFRNNTTGGNSISFSESMKSTSQSNLSVFSESSTPFVNISLYELGRYNSGAREQDAVGLRFYEDGNNDIDQMDAYKFSNLSENLALLNSNQLLSIESRAIPIDGEVYELFINNYKHEDYVFLINLQNFPSDLQLSLVDNHTNEIFLLSNGLNEIEFFIDSSVQQSIDPHRFSVKVDNINLNVDEFNKNDIVVYPNPVLNTLNINLSNALVNNATINIFDLNGRLVTQKKYNDIQNKVSINVNSLNQGVYIIEIQDGETSYKSKFVKK